MHKLGCSLAALLVACAAPPAAAPDIAEQSVRSVLPPARLGWLSSQGPSRFVPSAVALGGRANGRVLLYLEFAELEPTRRLLRADLLLETAGAPGDSVEVELSRSEPARWPLAHWSEQPQALYPRFRTRLEAKGAPVRLEVTAMVRAQNKPGEPLRLLVRAEPGGGAPVLVQTGAAGGAGPRLEVYFE